MTRERRQDVVLVAVIVSIALHIALMMLAKPLVMAHVARGNVRVTRHDPMNVTKPAEAIPDPVRLAEVLDLAPLQDAPPVRETAVSTGVGDVPAPEPSRVAADFDEAPSKIADVPPSQAKFDAAPIRLDDRVTAKIARLPIDVARPADVLTAPSAALGAAIVRPVLPNAATAALPVPERPKARVSPVVRQEDEKKKDFVPVEEVLEKVDEKIVEAEKNAVRELVDAPDAKGMAQYVNLSAVVSRQQDWTYFKIWITPRAALRPVPKDVVVLIDASGSIGGDRMGSIRRAAKKILRSATNSGDRFNLVAFRDRFTYAFRAWQPCTRASFEASDRWLNNVAAHGRTDIFSTISSVLTLPRDPTRPLIALVVTDGDANSGVSGTADILSRFTALNDGLVSVYMYGVKSSANRELIDVLTHGNRGESFIFNGYRWNAGEGIEGLSERFRDPVLSDLRVVFSSASRAEAYPRRLRNLYRGDPLCIVGRVPASVRQVGFSLKGLNGREAYEDYFDFSLSSVPEDSTVIAEWRAECAIDRKLK